MDLQLVLPLLHQNNKVILPQFPLHHTGEERGSDQCPALIPPEQDAEHTEDTARVTFPPQKPPEEEPWGFLLPLTSHRCPIHDLVLGYGVVLVVHIGPCPRCLPLDDVYLHVLDLDPHQQEVNLPHNHIF